MKDNLHRKSSKMKSVLIVCIVLNIIFNPILEFLGSESYAQVNGYDYSNISILPMKDSQWSIRDSNELNKAMVLLRENYSELNKTRIGVEAIKADNIIKDTTFVNTIIRFELIRTQMIYLVNLIEHQVENRDNLSLSDKDNSYIQEQVKNMIATTKSNSYQNKYGKVHELYEECEEGQSACGPRTKGTDGRLLDINNLNIPTVEHSGEIRESDRIRLKEELATITSIIESTMDLTEPTNIGNSDSKDRLAWLTNNADQIVERMKMMNLLINVYEGLGLDREVLDSNGLRAKLENNQSKLKQLVEASDLNIDVSVEDSNPTPVDEDNSNNLSSNPLEDVDLNEISELIDTKSNDMSNLYKGLFAWTSNFTPFETNINDPYIMTHLTEEERSAYNKYGQNRSIIYSAEGSKGIIKGLKEGIPYQFKVISLGEFLDKVEVKEMALFIKNQSTDMGAEMGLEGQKNVPIDQNAETKSSVENNNMSNSNTQNNSKGIFSWFNGKNGKEDTNSPNWYSMSDDNVKANPTTPKFVGPVYATSGSLVKEIWGVNDAGDRGVDNIFYKVSDNIKEMGRTITGKNTSINRLKGNTMNMNYFLMYNTLKNKSHLAPALEEDMNKPLYVDFIGNILTQSGYVVIPAGANYTYYNYSDKLPSYNAMFLNSYPEVVLNEKQTYSMIDSIDKEKMMYQKSKDGIIRLSKLDEKGTAIKESFYALPLLSKATFSEGSVSVNFMDDITMYKQSTDPFTLSDTTDQTEKDLTFINNGIVMKTITEGVERIVNLKKISGDGRGIDWKLIKDANLQNLDNKTTKVIDSITLASLAGTVSKSTDGQVSVVINDYKSKDEQLRDAGGLTSVLGEIYEGFHNRFISSFGINYLLYTPKLTESTLTENLAQYGVQAMIIISIVAIIIFLIGFTKAIYQRDMVGVKGIAGSILAITCITAFFIFGVDHLVGIFYNRPAEWILKDKLPLYILEDVEQTYKDQDSNFFDKSDKKMQGGNSTLIIEKLKNSDVEMLRKEMNQTDEIQSAFYLPTLDQTRLNIIGDKVYLQGKDLKINVRDLMEISKVEDEIGPDLTLQLKSTYTGYGELAYYMPYFNILDSFVSNLNSYTEETRPSYRLIQYRKGFTKSTGRAEDFFKSVVFISPDMLDDHVRSLVRQYQGNEITKNYYTNQYTLIKEGKDDDLNTEIDMIEGQEPTPEYTEDGIKVGVEKDDIFGESYFKDEILPISMSNELLQELNNVNNIVMYLTYHSNMDFRDWLGLKKVLLLEEDEGLFPSNYHNVIRETKWFPSVLDYTDEELLDNIYEVNLRTRDFVIDKIIPISGKVSDDTIIKVVSLYATMEFNKVFSRDGVSLYPRTIDLAGLSNEHTTKSIMIPQEQIFVGNSHRTALYLAKETGWAGLLLASIDRLMYFIRMVIRIGIIKVILLSSPIVALYLYISKKNKHSNYLRGALVSSIMITFLYLLELLWYNIAFIIVNSKGTMSVLTIGLVPQIVLTSIYILLLKTVFQDLSNFGYNNIRAKGMRLMGGYDESSYSDIYDQIANTYEDNEYDGMSGLNMRNVGEYGYGYNDILDYENEEEQDSGGNHRVSTEYEETLYRNPNEGGTGYSEKHDMNDEVEYVDNTVVEDNINYEKDIQPMENTTNSQDPKDWLKGLTKLREEL